MRSSRNSTRFEKAGLYKRERVIAGPQQARSLRAAERRQPVLNLCANNYLGLAHHPAIVEAAQQALDSWGYGLASVRFICGTQSIHKQLEATTQRVSRHGRHDSLQLVLRCQRRLV